MPPPPTDLNIAAGKLLVDLEEFAKIARRKDARCAELESDNAYLRSRLEVVRTARSSGSVGNVNVSVNGVPIDSDMGFSSRNPTSPSHRSCVTLAAHTAALEKQKGLEKRLAELQAKHDLLELKHAKCGPCIEDAMKKYKAAKESVHQWRIYIEKQKKKQAIPRPISDGLALVVSTPSPLPRIDNTKMDIDDIPRATRGGDTNQKAQHGNPADVATNTDEALPSFNPLPAEQNPLHRSESGTSAYEKPMRITSSETTEYESNANCNSSPPGLHRAGSDSEPTVVSVRPVKRKRSNPVMPPPVRIKQEPGLAEGVICLPSGGLEETTRRVPRHETSDLDAFMATTRTPSKNKRLHLEHHRASSEELPQPPPTLTNVSFLSEQGAGEREATHDRARVKPEPTGCPLHMRNGQSGVLSPLSVNVPTKSKSRHTSNESKGERDGSAARIGILSEDGDLDSSQSGVKPKTETAAGMTTKTPGSERLLNLLAEPTPENNVFLQRRALNTTHQHPKKPQTPSSNQQPGPKAPSPSRGKHAAARRPIITPLPTRPDTANKARLPPSTTPTTTNTAQNRSHRPLLARPTSASPPPLQPEDEPLRLRPIESLNLEDFKVNPKYMNSEFAFADTLRRRDDRRCMSGCTKPECCGNAFLKAVQIGGLPNPNPNNNNTTNTNLDTNQPDSKTLEAYLGPEWEAIIGSYPADKRRDLGMQARANYLGQHFGKHRQAFERRSTPPGFWRTDMPTTQEEADDRERAREMVRVKVQERRREAVKDGGRWLFRDE